MPTSVEVVVEVEVVVNGVVVVVVVVPPWGRALWTRSPDEHAENGKVARMASFQNLLLIWGRSIATLGPEGPRGRGPENSEESASPERMPP